jgi:hypothetical protein
MAVHNASVYQRRVAAKGAAGRAAYDANSRPQVIGGFPAVASRPPVSGVAPAGIGRPPVNGRAPAGASASSEIAVLQNGLSAMLTQARAMLRMATGLAHEKTAVTAAASRRSASGEAFRETRMALNARERLADGEAHNFGPRPLLTTKVSNHTAHKR